MYINSYEGNGISNILVISGLHGNELSPLYVSKLIIENVEKIDKNVYKRLTFVNMPNMYGILNKVRDYQGNSDLNRIFKPDLQADYIKDLINQNDIVIDIHASPYIVENFWLLDNDNYVQSYSHFLNGLGQKIVYKDVNAHTVKGHVNSKDAVAFTLEINGMSEIDVNASHKAMNSVIQVINNIKSLEKKSSDVKYVNYKCQSVEEDMIVIDYTLNSNEAVIQVLTLENELKTLRYVYDVSTLIFIVYKGVVKKSEPILALQEYNFV